MHSSLLEKFGLSLLICAWLVFGSITLGDMLVQVDEGNIDALRIVTEADDATEEVAEAEEEEVVDFATLMAGADMTAGAKVFKKCAACHSIESGGKHKVGPNLWNIVGRAQAGAEGFSYSPALTGLGGTWTFEELDAFLADVKGYAPGTKMSFKGINKPAKRAALVLFLTSMNDSPLIQQ